MFKMTETNTIPAWVHNEHPVWIRYYPLARTPYWQAYRSLKKPKAGQMPWAVDNKKIGDENGFKTLEDAEQNALEFIKNNFAQK
jgi:hypothetical protein